MSTAPGRIVFPVGDGSIAKNVDAGGTAFATALPDGGALLFEGSGGPTRNGLYAAKIVPLDRTFGTNGASGRPPFDMLMLNDMDRFHLVMDVIDRVPGLCTAAAGLRQEMADERLRHRATGDDPAAIRDWTWPA